MGRIAAVHAWEALDSRGRPTVACRVVLDSGATGTALVPKWNRLLELEALEDTTFATWP
jgi:enolase